MARRYLTDDQYRDDATHSNPEVDILTQPAADIPVTDPFGVVTSKLYTNASKAATVNLTATNAIVLEDDEIDITAVRYTPTTNFGPPTSGNSRTWLLKKASTTLATLVVDDATPEVTSTTGILFTLEAAAGDVTAGTLTLESAYGGAGGLADPGGVLSVELTFRVGD